LLEATKDASIRAKSIAENVLDEFREFNRKPDMGVFKLPVKLIRRFFMAVPLIRNPKTKRNNIKCDCQVN
jgi:hypothetical protein